MKRAIFTFIIISIVCICNAQYNNEVKIEHVLKTDTTTLGQKFQFPQSNDSEVTILKITIPPKKSTGWHKHKIHVFAYILEGTLTVEFENNETMQFSANTSFAEMFDTYHNGTNNGNEDLILIAFYIGKKNEKLSIFKE